MNPDNQLNYSNNHFNNNPIIQNDNATNITTIAHGEPLKLAVVGHTNTGKTSILRTLLRDVYFGDVKN